MKKLLLQAWLPIFLLFNYSSINSTMAEGRAYKTPKKSYSRFLSLKTFLMSSALAIVAGLTIYANKENWKLPKSFKMPEFLKNLMKEKDGYAFSDLPAKVQDKHQLFIPAGNSRFFKLQDCVDAGNSMKKTMENLKSMIAKNAALGGSFSSLMVIGDAGSTPTVFGTTYEYRLKNEPFPFKILYTKNEQACVLKITSEDSLALRLTEDDDYSHYSILIYVDRVDKVNSEIMIDLETVICLSSKNIYYSSSLSSAVRSDNKELVCV